MRTIKIYLQQIKPRAVEQIVTRARTELSDYAQRDIAELTVAVARAYDAFCDAALTNNMDSSVTNAGRVITENAARHINPTQIARTPTLICEVILDLLKEAGSDVDAAERTRFEQQAQHSLIFLTSYGHAKIATNILESANANIRRRFPKE